MDGRLLRFLQRNANALIAVVKPAVHPDPHHVVADVVHDKINPSIAVKVGRCHDMRVEVVGVVNFGSERLKGKEASCPWFS